jgi:hypothetical protein
VGFFRPQRAGEEVADIGERITVAFGPIFRSPIDGIAGARERIGFTQDG